VFSTPLHLIPPPYRDRMEFRMSTTSTEDPEGDRQRPASDGLKADVERLKDFDRRLGEVDRRRAAQRPSEGAHWSPALGGEPPDHR
jgi:hypothetical protein